MGSILMKNSQKAQPKYKVLSLALALAISTSIVVDIEAVAEEVKPEEAKTNEMGVITVTAQKRAQNVNEVGMSISVFSDENLDDFGIFETQDLAAFIPGFNSVTSDKGVPVYTLRGVGNDAHTTVASATVAVYVDEFAIPYSVMTRGANLDLERVEILKGPQGTLYGRNTTGGAINYLSAKPSEDFEGNIKASYSSFSTFDVEGVVNLPLTENLRARLAAKTQQSSEGWQENVVTNDTLGEKDTSAVRFSLAADFSDNFDGLLQVSWNKNQSDTQAQQIVMPAWSNYHPTVVALTEDVMLASVPTNSEDAQAAGWIIETNPAFNQETFTTNLTLKYSINDSLDAISLTGYSSFEDNGTVFARGGHNGVPYADASPYQRTALNLGVGDPTPVPFHAPGEEPAFVGQYEAAQLVDIEYFSQEFRFIGSEDNIDWVSGIYYSKDTNDSSVLTNTSLLASTTDAFFGSPYSDFSLNVEEVREVSNIEADSIGAYFHTTWRMNEQLNLTAGIRYGEDEKKFEGCLQDGGDGDLAFAQNVQGFGWNGPIGAGECVTWLLNDAGDDFIDNGFMQDVLKEDSLSYNLGLDWFVSKDTMVYGSYKRGFKAGDYPMTAAVRGDQLLPTVQEQLDAFELGFKATLLNGEMQFNASIYYYDYQDKQLPGTVLTYFGPLGRVDNIPNSNVNGAELEIQWRPTDGLYTRLATSYVDSEIEEYSASDDFGVDQVLDGSPFPNTAEFQTSAVVGYEWTLSNDLYATVALDANYTSDVNRDFKTAGGSVHPALIMDSYTLFNTRVSVNDESGNWSVQLWVRNLTDQFYLINAGVRSDALTVQTGMPRTVGITYSYYF